MKIVYTTIPTQLALTAQIIWLDFGLSLEVTFAIVGKNTPTHFLWEINQKNLFDLIMQNYPQMHK